MVVECFIFLTLSHFKIRPTTKAAISSNTNIILLAESNHVILGEERMAFKLVDSWWNLGI